MNKKIDLNKTVFELTEEYLADLGFKVDREEFNKYMEAQKELARANIKNTTKMASLRSQRSPCFIPSARS